MTEILYKFIPYKSEKNNSLIFIGNGNIKFGLKVASSLNSTQLSDCRVKRFADGEIKIPNIKENIRNRDCIIIQSISKTKENSVNDLIMELYTLIDAIVRAGASSVTVALPCFPYQRQDRKSYSRAPITSKMVATFLEKQGVNRVICFDLHAEQIQGFFDHTQLDNLYTEPYHGRYIEENFAEDIKNGNFLIVAPDEGGAKRATSLSNRLKCPVVMIYKERNGDGKVDKMTLMGNVKDKKCFIIDDMIDTGGTACKCAELLKEHGASLVLMGVAHAILSGTAIKKIRDSKFDKFIVTNTLNIYDKIPKGDKVLQDKIVILDVSDMMASAIHRSIIGQSVSELIFL